MSGVAQHTISNEKFLTMSTNLLAKLFFDSSRTDAKRAFQELCDGKKVGVSRVKMDDESTLDVLLTLNCDEYCGKISFSSFRSQLGLLLQRFVDVLKEEQPVPVMEEQGGNAAIFKLPILHADNEIVNALILGWAPLAAGQLELRLMYLDPEQFRVDPEQNK